MQCILNGTLLSSIDIFVISSLTLTSVNQGCNENNYTSICVSKQKKNLTDYMHKSFNAKKTCVWVYIESVLF